MIKNIYLLRHASTTEEKLIFKGVIDTPLSEKGVEEACAMADKFAAKNIGFGAVYSSPLSRAVDTAVLAGGGLEVKTSPLLLDIDCGEWENRSVESVLKEEPELFAAWRENPAAFKFPGGESVAAAAERAGGFLREITERETAADVLVVTHRLIINLMVLSALEIDINKYWRFRYDNCSYTVIGLDNGYYLKAMNVN
jgi:broad specificity phosphatase PhoE